MDWPPVSHTFKAFKKELRQAFREHPPFKKWLKMKRNKNLVLTCYPSLKYAPFMHTVEDLKQMYMIDYIKERNAKYMIRFLAKEYSKDPQNTTSETDKLEHILIKSQMQSE